MKAFPSKLCFCFIGLMILSGEVYTMPVADGNSTTNNYQQTETIQPSARVSIVPSQEDASKAESFFQGAEYKSLQQFQPGQYFNIKNEGK